MPKDYLDFDPREAIKNWLAPMQKKAHHCGADPADVANTHRNFLDLYEKELSRERRERMKPRADPGD